MKEDIESWIYSCNVKIFTYLCGMTKFIIVDLDNTLYKVSDRIKLLPDYDVFHRRCYEDKPNEHIVAIIKRFANEYKIVFLTMRPVKYMNRTMLMLERDVHLYYDRLIMRANNDMREAHVYKLHMLKVHGLNKDNILFAIDDNESVIKAYSDAGINCLKVVAPNSYKPKRINKYKKKRI